jgi:hypothetical protein
MLANVLATTQPVLISVAIRGAISLFRNEIADLTNPW